MDKQLKIETHITKEIDDTFSIIIYIKNIIDNDIHDKALKHLTAIQNDDWRAGYVGDHQIRRLQRWHHHDNKVFCDKWKNEFDRWNPITYDNWLLSFEQYIQDNVSKYVGDIITKFKGNALNFNSVLINKYCDGNHFIHAHRDSEMIFGNNPTIVSVSLGATRQFIMHRVLYDVNNPYKMTRNHDEKEKDIVFDLESGSIVIMAGSSQKYYSHEVVRDENSHEPRYNLTFRDHKC
jgi:alkylated DNA repair dioxygenase AlkB